MRTLGCPADEVMSMVQEDSPIEQWPGNPYDLNVGVVDGLFSGDAWNPFETGPPMFFCWWKQFLQKEGEFLLIDDGNSVRLGDIRRRVHSSTWNDVARGKNDGMMQREAINSVYRNVTAKHLQHCIIYIHLHPVTLCTTLSTLIKLYYNVLYTYIYIYVYTYVVSWNDLKLAGDPQEYSEGLTLVFAV